MYKYNDIKDLDTFKEYILIQFPCININNVEFIDKLYDIFKSETTKNMRLIYDNLSLYMKSLRNNRGASILSIDFWKSMGWTDLTKIKENISKEQKKRSKRCKEYYINRGYSEEESQKLLAEYQSTLSNIRHKKYTKDEIKNQSVWSLQHWINLGYSEDDAKQKIRQYNGSCIECYKDETQFYKNQQKKIDVIKINYRLNPEKYLKNHKQYSSNEESDFFNDISKEINEVKHEQFGINVQKTKLYEIYDKSYIICDGYIKTNDGIIILEYDGTYWHDSEYDEIRDSVILEIRPDVLGIIRINDIFVRKNNIDTIKKEIEYAIKDIKSKKCKKRIIYES